METITITFLISKQQLSDTECIKYTWIEVLGVRYIMSNVMMLRYENWTLLSIFNDSMNMFRLLAHKYNINPELIYPTI